MPPRVPANSQRHRGRRAACTLPRHSLAFGARKLCWAWMAMVALTPSPTAQAAAPRPRRTDVARPGGLAHHKLRWDEPPTAAQLAPLRTRGGLRVLWWNIQRGQTNHALREGGGDPGPLETNLRALASSPRGPDVIALGEWRAGALSAETIGQLRRDHPHAALLPYSPRTREGVLVLSRRPMTILANRPLPYTPLALDADPAAEQAYRDRWTAQNDDERYYDKRYLRLRVHDREGHPFQLVPTHTAQPWDHMVKRAGGGLMGRAATALAILFGRQNPLINQVARLGRELEQDRSREPSWASEPLLQIGDFNLPRRLLLLPTASYRLLARGMKDVLLESPGRRTSWPSLSARTLGEDRPALQIDHALVSPETQVGAAAVLPLAGSDHYPLLVHLQAGVAPEHR
jgi:endonuclease/exonuclease/phosphatase family metal-dependent hydrolase